MKSLDVETAPPGDEAAAIATLTLAFAADPMTRWSWPDPGTYLDAFPKFARAFGGAACAKGTAHRIDGAAGVALWLPPGVEPDGEARGTLLGHALALADRDGVPAYLESSNPRNIGYYERHGFEQLGRIQNGSSPTLVPMLRKPLRRGRSVGQ